MSFADAMKTSVMLHFRAGWCVITITGSVRIGYHIMVSNPGNYIDTIDRTIDERYDDYAQAFSAYAGIVNKMISANKGRIFAA